MAMTRVFRHINANNARDTVCRPSAFRYAIDVLLPVESSHQIICHNNGFNRFGDPNPNQRQRTLVLSTKMVQSELPGSDVS